MDEFSIVRGLILRRAEQVADTSSAATALARWAEPHRLWLAGRKAARKERFGWRALLKALRRKRGQGAREARPAQPLVLAEALARALRFGVEDSRLLALAVAVDRIPRIAALARVIGSDGGDLPELMAGVAGCSPHALRRSPVFRLGLAHLRASRSGRVEVDIGWTLERLLDRESPADDRLIEAIVGPRQTARLAPADFGGHAKAVALLARLLTGALENRAPGINILIHGPPGTGKTELARTLADSIGAVLFSVGEADCDGEEPNRWDRVNALQLAHRALEGHENALLLFDEMEDLIGDARPGGGDWMTGREGSKIWINRLLETNVVPVIWTTNAVGNIDPAIVRRMSFVLHLDFPSPASARQMLRRIAADEEVGVPEGLGRLVDAMPQAATVARVAMRVGRMSGDSGDSEAAARALMTALRDGEPPRSTEEEIDLDLFETDLPLEALLDRMAGPGGPRDFSVLLTGPPGTGKTGLAAHLAHRLDRPLLVKRASDLLSKWVGDTEKQIADAFREAERRDAVLLFDEVDSILFDRRSARHSWEVTQVNELLTWLDRHPLPFVAATNHGDKLDPAALRRFVFKIGLRPFGPERSARAFRRFFGCPAPLSLGAVANLTPGDFAVVRRQVRHVTVADPEAIVARLAAEAALKPCGGGRIGF